MIFNKIFAPFKEYYLLPVRLALGWIFIAHGGQKLFGLWGGQGLQGFASFLETLGLKPGILWAILAAVSEFLGGILVLVGFHARLGALLMTAVMVVAIATVHAPNGFFLSNGGYEYNVALLGLTLCILLNGSGRFSAKND